MGRIVGLAGASPSFPWIVAHRGAHREAPENTVPAFDAALKAGAAGIEFDVQLSADGLPVIWHDRTLTRIGGGRRRVSDLSVAELKKLDAGARKGKDFRDTRLPTLGEVLERYGRRTRLFVEIKSRERDRRGRRHELLTTLVVKAIAASPGGMKKDFFLLSFDRQVLEAAHRLERSWKYVLNIEDPSSLPSARSLRRLPLFGCCLPIRRLTPPVGGRLRERGLRVMTYACNRPFQVRRALEAGADVIMSDVPDRARDYLGRARRR